MIYDRVDIREKYYNGFLDLQYRNRKNKEKLAKYILLLIFFMEFFSSSDVSKVENHCPFILKIKNIDNVKAVLKAVESGVNGEGKLKPHVDEFVEINENELDYLTTIIPQNEQEIQSPSPNMSKKKERYYNSLKERADQMEQFNEASIYVNTTLLGKKLKQWNTQRDSKVRKTTFHSGVDRIVVPINDNFVIQGINGFCPADSKLPSWERLGCRCYLTFI